MHAPIWGDDELSDVQTLVWEEFKARWGHRRSYHAWRHKRRELKDERLSPPKPTVISQPPEEVDIERLLDAWIAYETEQRKLHQVPCEIEVSLETDRPIGICFMSDLHAGGKGVDMRQIVRDTKQIVETPGLYPVIGGDIVNNFVTDKLAHAGRGDAAPSAQWEMARWVLHSLAPKLIAAGSGNHDRWTQRLADQDPYLALLQRVPTLFVGKGGYLGEGGLIKLRLGTDQVAPITYRIYRKHRGGGGKSNPLAGPMGLLRFPEYEEIDIAVTEHIHTPAFGSWRHAKREVFGIVCGSYKVEDEHAREWGFYNHDISVPTVILWPGQRQMRFERNLNDAADYLKTWWQ